MLPGLIVRTTERLRRAISRPATPPSRPSSTAFGEQLAHESLPDRAERGADRDLLLTAARPRQQQVGDVRARNEQHETHGAQQHEQRALNIADDLLDAAGRR